jgi:hypothetical protein
VHLTFVRSELDNSTSDHAEHEWADVARFLTTHRTLATKGDLGVIFARFVNGECRRRRRFGSCTPACPGTNHRIDENVEVVTALGLDFDEDASPERLVALGQELDQRGLRYLYYSTWSSTPEIPRIRVVIALDADVPAAQFHGFWDAVVSDLGIRDVVDSKCRNPGRLFYTPQCPPGSIPQAKAFDGTPLATAQYITYATSAAPSDPPQTRHTDYPPASQALIHHALTRLKAHGQAVTGSGGNAHTRAAWGILTNDLALSDTEARTVFRLWDIHNQPPWGETAWAGPCRTEQAWDSPRGAMRDRFESSGVDIFGDALPQPSYPSVLVGEHEHIAAVPVRRYGTGFPDLDLKLGGGITTRQLAVILAPPGDGKSALAVNLSIFIQKTIPVLYASTELETDELEARIAAQILGCPWRDIVDGRIERPVLRGLRIFIIGCERLPMGDAALQAIDFEIVRITALYGVPPMCVIDYLQDLARGTDERSVRGKIGGLAMVTRAMSQRLDCPMLVISSVSRTYYGMKRAAELRQAEDATVYLAAAKESGDVDYAAAAVLFLDVVGAEAGAGFRCARVAVAKSRHGETGFVGARFVGATGRWQAAPDEVLMAAGKREIARRSVGHDADDMRVLAAITQAAREGVYRKADAWRVLIAEVSQNGVREAIARLIAAGRLGLDEMHPTLHRKQGKGEFVIPIAFISE